MSSAPVHASLWGMSCDVPSSFLETIAAEPVLTDDWLACFDFSDLPPAPLTQVDLTELFDLDCTAGFDISDLLAPDENPPSFAQSDENPHSADRSEKNPLFISTSEGFSSIFEPDKANETTVHLLEHHFTFESDSPPHQSNGPSLCSSPNSDAGSSIAVAEGTSFLKDGLDNQEYSQGHGIKNSATQSVSSSRHKRQHEDTCSDMEGDHGEGKSQLDPSDKRQQRLLRNRELAFESRQRKKCYVSDLEAKCKMLEQERNQLQQQVCFSAAENAVLKEELSRMKKLQGKDGVAEPAVLLKGSLPLEFLSLLICLLLMAQLSLCASPFLASALRAVMCPQSLIKTGGLLKEQVDSGRCSYNIVDNGRRSLDGFCFHKPFWVSGLYMTGPTWQVPFLPWEPSVCKSFEGATV